MKEKVEILYKKFEKKTWNFVIKKVILKKRKFWDFVKKQSWKKKSWDFVVKLRKKIERKKSWDLVQKSYVCKKKRV